jgi:hypothetical protein
MKKTLVSLMIIGALLAATPASAATRRWGQNTYVRLWQSSSAVLKGGHSQSKEIRFLFKNKVAHTIHFDCRWTEHHQDGTVLHRRWRGFAHEGAALSRGPYPTGTLPHDATCLVR